MMPAGWPESGTGAGDAPAANGRSAASLEGRAKMEMVEAAGIEPASTDAQAESLQA